MPGLKAEKAAELEAFWRSHHEGWARSSRPIRDRPREIFISSPHPLRATQFASIVNLLTDEDRASTGL